MMQKIAGSEVAAKWQRLFERLSEVSSRELSANRSRSLKVAPSKFRNEVCVFAKLFDGKFQIKKHGTVKIAAVIRTRITCSQVIFVAICLPVNGRFEFA